MQTADPRNNIIGRRVAALIPRMRADLFLQDGRCRLTLQEGHRGPFCGVREGFSRRRVRVNTEFPEKCINHGTAVLVCRVLVEIFGTFQNLQIHRNGAGAAVDTSVDRGQFLSQYVLFDGDVLEPLPELVAIQDAISGNVEQIVLLNPEPIELLLEVVALLTFCRLRRFDCVAQDGSELIDSRLFYLKLAHTLEYRRFDIGNAYRSKRAAHI